MRGAGADRYLLRHETADRAHYEKLHPEGMSFDNRMRCLRDLKELGFQVGCGFMVGSPFQTPECLAEDLEFIADFSPDMCGIGPFIPHKDTPFRDCPAGTLEMTTFLLVAHQAHKAEHSSPVDDCARDYRPARAGKGNSRRRKRRHAEPQPGRGEKEIRALQQQNLHR